MTWLEILKTNFRETVKRSGRIKSNHAEGAREKRGPLVQYLGVRIVRKKESTYFNMKGKEGYNSFFLTTKFQETEEVLGQRQMHWARQSEAVTAKNSHEIAKSVGGFFFTEIGSDKRAHTTNLCVKYQSGYVMRIHRWMSIKCSSTLQAMGLHNYTSYSSFHITWKRLYIRGIVKNEYR